ncbi:hypothetical protein VNO78_19447 [Psophocarpus tetragonolobus]|uniref:Uncharacterized protein n=1 Tax=Psophocarpus tetragonolobus TaxID=3891 RepID=A0AAN9S7L6_PSOTE
MHGKEHKEFSETYSSNEVDKQMDLIVLKQRLGHLRIEFGIEGEQQVIGTDYTKATSNLNSMGRCGWGFGRRHDDIALMVANCAITAKNGCWSRKKAFVASYPTNQVVSFSSVSRLGSENALMQFDSFGPVEIWQAAKQLGVVDKIDDQAYIDEIASIEMGCVMLVLVYVFCVVPAVSLFSLPLSAELYNLRVVDSSTVSRGSASAGDSPGTISAGFPPSEAYGRPA